MTTVPPCPKCGDRTAGVPWIYCPYCAITYCLECSRGLLPSGAAACPMCVAKGFVQVEEANG